MLKAGRKKKGKKERKAGTKENKSKYHYNIQIHEKKKANIRLKSLYEETYIDINKIERKPIQKKSWSTLWLSIFHLSVFFLWLNCPCFMCSYKISPSCMLY